MDNASIFYHLLGTQEKPLTARMLLANSEDVRCVNGGELDRQKKLALNIAVSKSPFLVCSGIYCSFL